MARYVTSEIAYQTGRWDIPLESNLEALDNMLARAQFQRPIFETGINSDEIIISPGARWVKGYGLMWWDTPITYELTSLAGGAFSHLYIDRSALPQTVNNELTAAQFIDYQSVPAWNPIKRAVAYGNDVCLFAVLGASSSAYVPFTHNGGRYVQYQLPRTELIGGSELTYTRVVLDIPGFSNEAQLDFALYPTSANGSMIVSLDGSNSYFVFAANTSVGYREYLTKRLILPEGDVWYQVNNAGLDAYIYTCGYYLPAGM
jgi:hypothetical protein